MKAIVSFLDFSAAWCHSPWLTMIIAMTGVFPVVVSQRS